MRVKKQKQVRRHLRFYKTCCGFREPFKVLCDGNFVHAALGARMGALQDSLTRFLGATTKSFVTRCVIQELRKLGDDFSGTVLAARRLNIAKCNHEPTVSAADCLEALLGKNNPEHFLTATQDAELRKKIRKVTGGGIIFIQNTGFIMEPPSSQQIAYARLSEQQRLHMAEREQKIIEQRAKLKAEAVNAAEDTPAKSDLTTKEGQPVSKERIKKRKRPKGPNPLSQMKKKEKTSTSETNTSVTEVRNDDGGAESKRTRHRKRRRKQSASVEDKKDSE
ncbi:hypothetical protein R1sor_027437 [Riccia sorocarpa]|uniref:UTP23 sensor motif region domain-containing protein n=1 Tax=Riccia sorocarpa TaxID=122646 RepID=A0ABD3GGC1_9MARC